MISSTPGGVVSMSVEARKQLGNDMCNSQRYSDALSHYSIALDDCLSILCAARANRALCRLKTEDFTGAVDDCEEVLKMVPDHRKAIHRRQLAIDQIKLQCNARVDNHSNSSLESPESIFVSPSDHVSKVATFVGDIDSTLEIEALKEQGNQSVALGTIDGYLRASSLYSAAIAKSTALLCALYSNRALVLLKLFAYGKCVDDCDRVLALDATHVKAAYRRTECLKALNIIAEQKAGRYDYLTLPFDPFLQEQVCNFYGPICVRMTKDRGRGLFTTRDVQAGELLFVEKAFAFRRHSRSHSHAQSGIDPEDSHLDSQTNLVSDIVTLIERDPQANAILSYLQTDTMVPNQSIPDFEDFRSGKFDLKPQVSVSEVRGAVETNCFAFHMGNDPSTKDRQQMAESLCPHVSRQAFYTGLLYRAKRAQIYANIRQQKKNERLELEKTTSLDETTTTTRSSNKVTTLTEMESSADGAAARALVLATEERAGTGLWIVGSFMNHSTDPSATREFIGQLFLCHAWRALRKGEELTNTYSTDPVALRNWGIHVV